MSRRNQHGSFAALDGEHGCAGEAAELDLGECFSDVWIARQTERREPASPVRQAFDSGRPASENRLRRDRLGFGVPARRRAPERRPACGLAGWWRRAKRGRRAAASTNSSTAAPRNGGRNGCVTATSGRPTTTTIANCSIATSSRRGAAARSTCWLARGGKHPSCQLEAQVSGHANHADREGRDKNCGACNDHHPRARFRINQIGCVRNSATRFISTDAPITIAATTTASTISQRIAPRIRNRCSSAGAVPSFSSHEA